MKETNRPVHTLNSSTKVHFNKQSLFILKTRGNLIGYTLKKNE